MLGQTLATNPSPSEIVSTIVALVRDNTRTSSR
jgi:hypothetical protein